uniref:Uncharacterized protein n=1 Tax=Triticum urartu TaxID=4572 RepID=A0A8R7JX98_TRIUA
LLLPLRCAASPLPPSLSAAPRALPLTSAHAAGPLPRSKSCAAGPLPHCTSCATEPLPRSISCAAAFLSCCLSCAVGVFDLRGRLIHLTLSRSAGYKRKKAGSRCYSGAAADRSKPSSPQDGQEDEQKKNDAEGWSYVRGNLGRGPPIAGNQI